MCSGLYNRIPIYSGLKSVHAEVSKTRVIHGGREDHRLDVGKPGTRHRHCGGREYVTVIVGLKFDKFLTVIKWNFFDLCKSHLQKRRYDSRSKAPKTRKEGGVF